MAEKAIWEEFRHVILSLDELLHEWAKDMFVISENSNLSAITWNALFKLVFFWSFVF